MLVDLAHPSPHGAAAASRSYHVVWSLWCAVVMTMHRLTAGAGYKYLVRHTASGDCDRSTTQPLVAYYTESGNPPGRWLGSGLTAFQAGAPAGDRIVSGSVVTEPAMANLFGQGRHPLTGAPLGRPYPQVVPVVERIAAKVAALPATLAGGARSGAVDTITRIELAKPVPRAIASQPQDNVRHAALEARDDAFALEAARRRSEDCDVDHQESG